MSNPLLDDLRDDLVADSLSRVAGYRVRPSKVDTGGAWHSAGYIAKVRILACRACGGETPILDGVALDERKESLDGMRRLTFLGRGWQVPCGQPFKREVTREPVAACGWCIDGLFPVEVDASQQPRAMNVGSVPAALPPGLELPRGE